MAKDGQWRMYAWHSSFVILRHMSQVLESFLLFLECCSQYHKWTPIISYRVPQLRAPEIFNVEGKTKFCIRLDAPRTLELPVLVHSST
jgi:hypothetical protein